MKKKLAVGLLTMVVAVSAFAQAQWRPLSLLNSSVQSLIISNKIGFTNLLSPNLGVGLTNSQGVTWTNAFGYQVVAGTNDTTQLFVDIPLWSDRNGQIPLAFIAPTNQTYGGSGGFLSGAELTIHFLSGGSGANSPVNFTMVPVSDGVHESTQSADYWTVGVTANTTSEVTVITNVPLYKWPGCKSLRVKWAVNTDTDASSQVVLDTFTVTGFIP